MRRDSAAGGRRKGRGVWASSSCARIIRTQRSSAKTSTIEQCSVSSPGSPTASFGCARLGGAPTADRRLRAAAREAGVPRLLTFNPWMRAGVIGRDRRLRSYKPRGGCLHQPDPRSRPPHPTGGPSPSARCGNRARGSIGSDNPLLSVFQRGRRGALCRALHGSDRRTNPWWGYRHRWPGLLFCDPESSKPRPSGIAAAFSSRADAMP